jgi:hypothetical protein
MMVDQSHTTIDPHEKFKVGARIRLSAMGRARSRRITVQTGVIIGTPHRTDALRILMDGKKQPITLHISYVELA